jgi:hypothetical protein
MLTFVQVSALNFPGEKKSFLKNGKLDINVSNTDEKAPNHDDSLTSSVAVSVLLNKYGSGPRKQRNLICSDKFICEWGKF